MIDRRILLREGVVRSADVLGQAVEVLALLVLRGFEHHMFKQVREPGTARWIVLAPDVIPNLNRCGRTLMVLDGKDRQPVGERSLPVFQRRGVQQRRSGARLDCRGRQNAPNRIPSTAPVKTTPTNLRNTVFVFMLLEAALWLSPLNLTAPTTGHERPPRIFCALARKCNQPVRLMVAGERRISQYPQAITDMKTDNQARLLSRSLPVCVLALFFTSPFASAESVTDLVSTWPQAYSVQRNKAAGLLTLSTPYYTVQHDIKRGGAISSIRLTHGKAANLLVLPFETRVQDAAGNLYSDLAEPAPRVTTRQDGLNEFVTVESDLRDAQGKPSDIRVKTAYEYRWGYVKIHKELTFRGKDFQVKERLPVFDRAGPQPVGLRIS